MLYIKHLVGVSALLNVIYYQYHCDSYTIFSMNRYHFTIHN